MSFIVRKGKTRIEWLPVTTSTALSANSIVSFTSGLLVAATSSTAASAVIGVLVKAIVSGDSDYATARLVPVRVPVEKNVVWEATTASAVATDIGTIADLTDAVTVNRGASSVNVFRILEVPSGTLVRGVLTIVG
jgi:hypothetical protein